MRLSEAIKNFDPNKSELAPIDYDAFMECMNIQGNFRYDDEEIFLKHFKGYYVQRKMDTDTVIGIIFYFFKDIFVGLSLQSGRKSGITIKWKDVKTFNSVKIFFNSFVDSFDSPPINIIDKDFGIAEYYSLNWSDEIMEKEAYLTSDGEMVEIVETEYNSKYVNVRRKNGLTGKVFVSDLKFKSKGF